jgi:group I intron endonuclease
MKQYVVYKITNTTNGKIYIGSSDSFVRRKESHFRLLRVGRHVNRHLQFAFTGDGEAAFTMQIVETVDEWIFLLPREQFWIWRTRAWERAFGYNLVQRPDGPHGHRHTAEARAKISAAGTGRKYPNRKPRSEESKAKASAALKGKKRKAETVAKVAAALKGRTVAPEAVAKMVATKTANGTLRSSHRKGAKHTPETLEKMSASQKGKPKLALLGRPKTPEHRAAISASRKGRKCSPEHMAKLHAGLLRRWETHRKAKAGKDTVT